MATNYPEFDPRPKRRKAKDNPYTIYSIGIDSDAPQFFVSFRDGQGTEHQEMVSREIFELFNQFELEDLSELNEADRHYEQSELTEESLHLRAVSSTISSEDAFLQALDDDRLRDALDRLPEVQRRRVLMYYFDEMTFEEIAVKEGCGYQRIQKSIERAKEKLKKLCGEGGVFSIL